MMIMSAKISDKFYQIIVYGIGVMYIFQVFLTVGGGTKFIPLTGVTLPFISYGGSSVMTTYIMFFIVQGIYIKSRNFESSSDEKNKKPDTKVH
jgi:cell division protein FtsW (lipid II flippase)